MLDIALRWLLLCWHPVIGLHAKAYVALDASGIQHGLLADYGHLASKPLAIVQAKVDAVQEYHALRLCAYVVLFFLFFFSLLPCCVC